MSFRLKDRAPRNQTELRADSSTIRYDLTMMLDASLRFTEAQKAGDIIGQNIALESFAIHCRALILFLYGHQAGVSRYDESCLTALCRFSQPRGNDIFAWDYYPDWHLNCPTPSLLIGDAKWRADKHVAHIVTDRRGVNQHGTGVESLWELQAVVKELAEAMSLFLSLAPRGNFDADEFQTMQERVFRFMGRPMAPIPSTPPGPVPHGSFINTALCGKTSPPDLPYPKTSIHAKTE